MTYSGTRTILLSYLIQLRILKGTSHMSEHRESAWYRDAGAQTATITTVVTLLAFAAHMIYGMVNEGSDVTVDDWRSAITPVVTGIVALLAIFYGRSRAFAAKTVAERTDLALKEEAARLR